jgi:hypothetical protein
MEDSSNKYALAALKDKRATLAGEIVHLKRQLAWAQNQLDHMDVCLTIFEPGFDPTKIGKKLVRKRVKLFRQGELGRLIIDALRRAGLGPGVRGNLAYQEWRQTVTRARSGKDVRWSLRA